MRLELAILRKARGNFNAVEHAWKAPSEVTSDGLRQGGLHAGGLKSSLVAKQPGLPQGSMESGISVMRAWLRLAVLVP